MCCVTPKRSLTVSGFVVTQSHMSSHFIKFNLNLCSSLSISFLNSKGSGKTVHLHSLAWAFFVCIQVKHPFWMMQLKLYYMVEKEWMLALLIYICCRYLLEWPKWDSTYKYLQPDCRIKHGRVFSWFILAIPCCWTYIVTAMK